MRHLRIIITLLALTAMASTTTGQSYLLDKVVAKVGSEFVLLSDVEDQFAYARTQDPTIEEDSKCYILDNIIAQKVIIYHAKLDSVEVSDEEVESQLDFRFENILRQMNGDEEFFKEYYGATIAEMKERYRDDQKQQILADRMQGMLINNVKVTPQEVQQFYDRIPADSLPYLDSEVELGEIVIKPEVNAEQKAIAREKLEKIRANIISGEFSFEAMALKFSEDPGSGARGGDLGFAKRGSYVPEFEATVYSLAKDEISEIIETEFGFHIIKMLERRGNSIRARHILIKPELTDADFEKAKVRLDSIKNLIEIDSISFEKAVKKFSNEDTESYNNNGRMKNRATGNTFFETDDLDPDIYFEIIDMNVGDLSNIIEFKDFAGETMFRIVKLQNITKPHKANLQQDYDKIKQFAKESKKAEYFQNWIQTKKKETYVEVVPEFQSCEMLQDYDTKRP